MLHHHFHFLIPINPLRKDSSLLKPIPPFKYIDQHFRSPSLILFNPLRNLSNRLKPISSLNCIDYHYHLFNSSSPLHNHFKLFISITPLTNLNHHFRLLNPPNPLRTYSTRSKSVPPFHTLQPSKFSIDSFNNSDDEEEEEEEEEYEFDYANGSKNGKGNSKRKNLRSTRQRSKKNEWMLAYKESYRTRFLEMLKVEYEEEVNMIKSRLLHSAIDELEEEGVALFNLSVKMDGYFFGKKVMHFFLSNGTGFLPSHHQFSQGDVVCISEKNPLEEGAVEGIVLKKGRRFLKVLVPNEDILNSTSKYRIDLYFNNISYDRCCLAVEYFSSIRKGKEGSGIFKVNEKNIKKNDLILSKNRKKDEVETSIGDGLLAVNSVMIGLECLYMKKMESMRNTENESSYNPFILNDNVNNNNYSDKEKSLYSFYDQDADSYGDWKKDLGSFSQSKSKSKVSNVDKVLDLNSLDLNDEMMMYGKEMIENGLVLTKKQNKNNELRNFRKKVIGYLEQMPRGLNESQKQAIIGASCRSLTLWKGPPGTGKTKTLLSFIEMMKSINNGQILACADSNVAVDNIMERLVKMGIRVIRIGQPAKVKESLLEHTLDHHLDNHPLLSKSIQMKEESMMQREKGREINNKEKRKVNAQKSTQLFKKSNELVERITNEILDKVDVIACTCVSAGDLILENRKFVSCVIDECTQATQPTSFIPLINSKTNCIVLVGDNNQLPPTVISKYAKQNGLDLSLFEILYFCGVECYLLNTQYRMHPSIAKFPSVHFYNNKLLSAVKEEERITYKGFKWPNINQPVAFLNCKNGKEECTKKGTSFFNHAEALLVFEIVQNFLEEGNLDGGCESIGIITPYRGQVRILLDLFLKCQTKNLDLDKLEIKTVDGFQGREKEIIIFSTVRSNEKGELGFVSDARRMNVGITRAKRGLIVVGSLPTLMHDPDWKAWIKHMQKLKLCIDA